MMAEMKGDFSHVKDKRRRRALEKLKQSGMQVSGVTDMDIDQLENVSTCQFDAGNAVVPIYDSAYRIVARVAHLHYLPERLVAD